MKPDATRQLYIQLAIDSGITPWTLHQYMGKSRWTAKEEGLDGDLASLMQFADLVATYQRERVAKWMMDAGYATGHGDNIEDLLAELESQAQERR